MMDKNNLKVEDLISFFAEIASSKEELGMIVDTVNEKIAKLDEYDKKKLERILRVISLYKDLDLERKKALVGCLFNQILGDSLAFENAIPEYECKKSGHKFTRWKEEVDYRESNSMNTKYYWWRYCKRCGKYEKSEKKPQSIIKAENNQYRKERIAELEAELSRLKKDSKPKTKVKKTSL